MAVSAVAIRAALAWALVSALSVAGVAEATTIKRIRSASGDDFSRIVIDVDSSATYRYGLVPPSSDGRSAARFYIDIDGVRLERGENPAAEIRDQRIVAVRTGQNKLRTARVVFELAHPVRTNVFSLPSPPRIVIDLTDRPGVKVQELASKTLSIGEAPKSASPRSVPSLGGPRRSAAPGVPSPPSGVGTLAGSPRGSPALRPPPTREAALHTSHPSGPVRGRSVVPPPPVLRRRPRIVIDAGHGGKDPGAKGLKGVVEKDVVLDIAKRVASKLKSRMDVDVFMTRTKDEYIPLDHRKDLANQAEADLFVSIHANAGRNSRAHGIESYYLKNTNDRATLRLAKLENGIGDLIKGHDVSTDADLPYILSDMVQGQKESDSIVLANHIQRELVSHLRPRYPSVKNLGVKQGPFLVLDGTLMASTLVEIGFVTNATEAGRVGSPTYRESLSEGVYRGIKRYFEDSKVPGLQ